MTAVCQPDSLLRSAFVPGTYCKNTFVAWLFALLLVLVVSWVNIPTLAAEIFETGVRVYRGTGTEQPFEPASETGLSSPTLEPASHDGGAAQPDRARQVCRGIRVHRAGGSSAMEIELGEIYWLNL